MHSFLPIILSALAAGAAAQVTLQPTTICRGATCTTCPVTETETRTSTATKTETSVSVQTTSVTVTKTDTVTQTTTKPCVSCPTLTSTGTVCATCLVPGCTTTAVVNKPAGCDSLPTASVSFPCDQANVCNQIGCKTVYAIKTV